MAKGKQTDKKPAASKKSAGATVTVEFRDVNDFTKIHQVGDDVSHFDADRLEKLINLGYVEGKAVAPTEDDKSGEGTEGSENGNDQTGDNE